MFVEDDTEESPIIIPPRRSKGWASSFDEPDSDDNGEMHTDRNVSDFGGRQPERNDSDAEFDSPKKRISKGDKWGRGEQDDARDRDRPVRSSWDDAERNDGSSGWANTRKSSSHTQGSGGGWGAGGGSRDEDSQEKENDDAGQRRSQRSCDRGRRPPPPKAARPERLQQQTVRTSRDFDVTNGDDHDNTDGRDDNDEHDETIRLDDKSCRSKSSKSSQQFKGKVDRDGDGSRRRSQRERDESPRRKDAVQGEILQQMDDDDDLDAPATPDQHRANDVNADRALDPTHSPSFRSQSELAEAEGITLPSRSGRYSKEAPSSAAAGLNDDGDESDTSVEELEMGPSKTATKEVWESPGTKAKVVKNPSYILVAHPRGERTEHVQCLIVREKSSGFFPLLGGKSKGGDAYQLILEDSKKLLIVAKKMGLNRKSNYHLFDMTRGVAGSTVNLTKKSGNYVGKLKATNMNRTDYRIVTRSHAKEHIGTIGFERAGMLSQMKEGSQPRRMLLRVPSLDANNVPRPVCDEAEDRMGYDFHSKVHMSWRAPHTWTHLLITAVLTLAQLLYSSCFPFPRIPCSRRETTG